ncbi:CD48 antigen-like [Scomber scombrus]|uniref:CD48 antigen-like n=1 Tax=Scomber scombrus TaxID=13677 RepID=UPI002DDB640B|nr:CD48 antigen-like [Scomber scombrus]
MFSRYPDFKVQDGGLGGELMCHKYIFPIKTTNSHNVSVTISMKRSSAVTTVFVQKGKNLHLDVNKPVVLVEDTEFSWTYNNNSNVVRLFNDTRTRISDSYKGRVEFSVQSHSLLLKNVQQSDSGVYTALISGDKNQRVAEYKVIIQDPVSPVQLSVKSVSNSTESCNLTVTCSTEDSLISSTFRCDTQTCNQEGGEQSEVTTSGSSFIIYLLKDSIICNHSNQVSWTRDMKEIWPLCPLTAVPYLGTAISTGIGIPVFLGLVLGCLIICKPKHYSDTEIFPDQTPNQTATVLSPNPIYDLAGFPAGPVQSTETDNIILTEKMYAQVTKAPKSNRHPELKNIDNDDDSVHSQDQIVACHDGF